jgi:hypothetical protein
MRSLFTIQAANLPWFCCSNTTSLFGEANEKWTTVPVQTINDEPDSCSCDCSAVHERAPSLEETKKILQKIIEATAAKNISASVIELTDWTDHLSVLENCAPEQEFDTTVLIEFFARDPSNIHTNEIFALQYGFADSYNTLSAELCDPIFCSILAKVSLEIDSVVGRHRRLPSSFGDPVKGSREDQHRSLVWVLTGKASIKGTCKGFGCWGSNGSGTGSTTGGGSSGGSKNNGSSSTNGSSSSNSRSTGRFANKLSTSRRMQLTLVLRRTSSGKDGGLLYKLSTAGGRSGGQSPAGGGGIDDRDSRRGVLESNIADSCRSCYCEGPDLRAPTSEEFTGKYNDSVTDHLVKSGVLQNLQAIGGDVSEVVAIILAGDLTAFDSNVFVEVVGDAEFVTLQEISLAPPKHCSMIHNDLTWFYSGWLNLSLRKELKELP